MTELARAVARVEQAARDVWEVMSPAQKMAILGHIEPEPPEDGVADRPRIAGGLHPGTRDALRAARLVEQLDSDLGRRDLTPIALAVLRAVESES